jgi:hypothetical protein
VHNVPDRAGQNLRLSARRWRNTLYARQPCSIKRSRQRAGVRRPTCNCKRFPQRIERETPPDLQLHLIADNYATREHPRVRRWLAEHPRIHMHFTPTSASWLNMVERFFRDLTEKQLRRGAFRSVAVYPSSLW